MKVVLPIYEVIVVLHDTVPSTKSLKIRFRTASVLNRGEIARWEGILDVPYQEYLLV
jgi:hypothetical protein